MIFFLCTDLHTCSQVWLCSHSCHCCKIWLCWAGEPGPLTGSWVQLKSKQLVFVIVVAVTVIHLLRCSWAHTKLAAGIPEWLGVEVGGVHAVRGRVDPGELLLVKVDERCGFLLHHLVGFGLTEWRHLPATVSCRREYIGSFYELKKRATFKCHQVTQKKLTINTMFRYFYLKQNLFGFFFAVLKLKAHDVLTINKTKADYAFDTHFNNSKRTAFS